MHGQTLGLPDPVFVDLDGASVATYVLEPESGRSRGDVVFCHGTPWSAAVWARIAHATARDHRVFLWDMPGYGASTMSASVPVDLVAQRRRFARLLEMWSLERPWVVAHDIGGAVALGTHLLESAEYAGLYLLDVVMLEPWGSPFFRLVAENEDVFVRIPVALHAALVREYIAGAECGELDPETLDALAAPWCGVDGRAAFYRQIARLTPRHTRPIAAVLGEVRCPTRIGWGADDPWIPVEQASRLRDLLPGAPEVAVFAGAGHLTPLAACGAVARELAQWLER
ncbi:alpha/beta hydrolase [Rhodococcus sp. HNM0569]|uniref:alpha/beta fold hydrolase n=1 Tax=Rhodococcus sp. HNM0569 TaxID=2716340 RepID=UPI00146A8B01|nr:alpha/beta hydrolase [Rhodococcus sp. HNM0569]NLU82545.1 alpha/beta hydrolase [Rhodococcus sp. HNM0569]